LNVPTSVSGTVLSNIRVVSDQGDDNWRNLNAICWLGFGTEVRGCEFWREFDSQGRGWIHDTVSYGDVGPWYLSEAAFRLYWDRNILENNHVETKDWPVGADGTRNYNWWDHYYKKWAKRVSYVYCIDSYIAHNTSKDVAVEDNMGEMLLAHGHNCLWYGQVLSNSGLTMTVRTDGLVNGQPLTLPTYNASDPNPVVGGPIPTGPSAWLWWMDVAPRSVVIQAGKGIGQVRRIVSATSNTITIDTPWLVEPDVTSIVSFSGFWENNIIYQNELNAFPVNYQQGNGTASVAIDHDGASYHNMAEGNLSRRTNTGRAILGTAQTGCYWNEMRDEIALDCHMGGYRIIDQFVNPVGTTLIGNAYRNCSGNVYEAVSMGVVDCAGMGTIVEDANVSAQIGYFLGGDIPYIPQSQTASVLYRNGSVAVTDSPREAVHVAKIVGDGMLVNNSYAGVTQPYFYETGISGYTSPKPLQRVAKFTGYVGHSVQDVLIPIANAGTMPMTWTVATSDPWITATVQANPVLSAESTAGRLVIGVNSDGLPTGRTLGSVTVNTGGTSAKIGVCVDILAGSPPNQAPVAVFTTSVAAGTAPITVSMDAGASYDADGTITSYYWDFGDGTYGTGATTSHEYAAEGTFTPILTVTDSFGLTGQAWKNVDVSKSLTNVTLSGSPTGVIDAGTIVTLTANANGGYQTKYKFLINSANGWVTLRDYQSANTCTWTPTEIGYYEIRVCAKASDSLRAYDVMSEMLTYPVGQIPNSGLVLWLKADTGISKDGSAVYAWADQSGANNNVSQYTDAAKRPTLVTDAASGRPAVEFAGGNQSLNTLGLVLSGTTAFTTFEVLKFNSVPANTYQYAWWNGQDSIAGGYGSSVSGLSLKLRMAWGSSDKAVTFADALALQQWYRMSSRYQGTTHQAWMNGSYIGQSSKYGSNFIGGFFSLGNFGPSSTKGLFGDIGEVLIYNRALTDTERASVDTYLTARWSPAAPRSIDKLRDVAALGDGVPVSITSAKVAVVASGIYTDGSVYVIEPDRTYGLKVTGAGSIAIWENLILTGVVDADQVTGEKVLRVSTVSKSAGTELNNLGMANKIVTASGQLVRVWGKVKEKTSSYITLDDGSGSPVRVQIDGLTTPMAVSAAVGNYMSATGPCGYMAGGVMAVRVRSGSDIRVY
jgi:hypothetical protein